VTEAAELLRGLTILLVDDDEVDRMSLRRALRSGGFQGELIEASDATRGIDVLRSQKVDSVFLDFNMPARDGLWFVREARARGVRTPLIVLTGQGDEHTAVELMKAGASDYFSKAHAAPERVVASLRNALRVVEAEDAFRQSEQRLRLAVEATELGTFDFNPITGELDWSERCKALFGLPAHQKVNYDIFLSGLHPEDRARADAAVQSALHPDGKGAYDVEYRTVGLNDGVERWVRATGRAFFDETGRAIRFIGTVQDIGDRKQLDEKRAQLLEAEQVARARAEEASRMREDLVAIVSHDLRNPLSAITTSAELLRMTLPSEALAKGAKRLETITRSAERMKRLISDLLDVASIDAGHLSVQTQPQSADALLAEVVEMLQPVAADKSIRLSADDTASSLWVEADKDRVLQVLSNLVGNAIKFTREGGFITLRTERDDSAVRFLVSDTGQGVSEEHLPHLFDRYWQAKKDGRLGIGLGLSIAKGIVEAHGGKIWAESTVGKGTTFCFTLRAADAPAPLR
jgi:PAS domain S-box-containing protein